MNISRSDYCTGTYYTHFNGLVMRNLEHEVRICQKIHTKVTITMSMLSKFFLNQTLVGDGLGIRKGRHRNLSKIVNEKVGD